jgi:hypothetical protein
MRPIKLQPRRQPISIRTALLSIPLPLLRFKPTSLPPSCTWTGRRGPSALNHLIKKFQPVQLPPNLGPLLSQLTNRLFQLSHHQPYNGPRSIEDRRDRVDVQLQVTPGDEGDEEVTVEGGQGGGCFVDRIVLL